MRMFQMLAAGALTLALLPVPVLADDSEDMDRLIDLMRIEETVEIMRKEGLRYGAEIGAEMLPDVDPKEWERSVARIYDPAKMEVVINQGFEAALEDKDVAALVDFFTSDLGQEIITLEIAARAAFLDEETEMAAADAFEMARDGETKLYQQVETIISDSDLVEFNVMGAMNANLMFYRGLADGGAIDLGEEDMLADVWAQEPEIRAESEAWLGSFLLLAYRPLSPDDLDTYAALFRTPEGRLLNTAIFEAYDRMYDEISYLLGQAVAEHMRSEEL